MRLRDTVYVNGRFCTQPLSGVQRYAQEILTQLDQLAREGLLTQRYILCTPPDARDMGLTHIEQRMVGRRNGHIWEQTSFARAARTGVALNLAMSGPLFHPRSVVVVHDAAIYRHPEHFSKGYVLAHSLIERVLARTARIATVSEFSRVELAQALRIKAADIIVAPNGAEHLTVASDGDVIDRLELGDTPYFLILGNLTRNKNMAVAMRALTHLPTGTAKLVAVGQIDALNAVFGTDLPPPSPDLLLTGRLNDAEVAGLLRHAQALIFPSIYEGFGIPPLEAMVNGCPVIVSNAGAVREVCGDAALYFDAHDDAALAVHMETVLAADPGWRATQVEKGMMRVARYSWRRSAATLADACAALAGKSPA